MTSPSCPKHTTGNGPCYCEYEPTPRLPRFREFDPWVECSKCKYRFNMGPATIYRSPDSIVFDVCPCCDHHMIRAESPNA